MIGHWWLYGRKWPSPPLPKRKLGPPKIEGPKKFEIFQAYSYKTHKKIFPSTKKIFVSGGWGGVYTMENKDTNTDYQKVVRVGDKKWEIVETTFGITFFVWDSYSLYFIKKVFKSHMKKITPTEKANSHSKLQFDISPSYIHVLQNGSAPSHDPAGGMQVMALEYQPFPLKNTTPSFSPSPLLNLQIA